MFVRVELTNERVRSNELKKALSWHDGSNCKRETISAENWRL